MLRILASCTSAVAVFATNAVETEVESLLQVKQLHTPSPEDALDVESWLDKFAQSPETTLQSFGRLDVANKRALLIQASKEGYTIKDVIESMPEFAQQQAALLLRRMPPGVSALQEASVDKALSQKEQPSFLLDELFEDVDRVAWLKTVGDAPKLTALPDVDEDRSRLAIRASIVAYRDSDEPDPDYDESIEYLTSNGWRADKKSVSLQGESDRDVAELWVKGAYDDCILAFRGSDSVGDFIKDIITVPVEYKWLPDVGKGITLEFDPLYQILKNGTGDDLSPADLRQCGHLTVTGHSLGAACAALFAHMANKEGDPEDLRLTVDDLYEFGPIPPSATPLTNDKREDGCFPGMRYANTNKRRVDFATWIGAGGRGTRGPRRNQLKHAKVRAVAIDEDGLAWEDLTCEEGSKHNSWWYVARKSSPLLHSSLIYKDNLDAATATTTTTTTIQ